MGEGARRRLGARALSRETHLEKCEQRKDYTKENGVEVKEFPMCVRRQHGRPRDCDYVPKREIQNNTTIPAMIR
jgi:hypothetical protein